MDYVVQNLTREVIKEKILSNEQQEILEKKIKDENKSPDEFNLENIMQIQEMSSDDYEKYLLSQSVESKENYMKNTN
jgi:adenylate kinase